MFRLYRLRGLLAVATKSRKDYEDRMRREQQHLYDDEEGLKVELADTDKKLRELALVAFGETGESPHAGVKIVQSTFIEYDDDKAFEWAKKHGLALSLDKSAFEKLMLADEKSRPKWVQVGKKPAVRIDSDLSKHFSEVSE